MSFFSEEEFEYLSKKLLGSKISKSQTQEELKMDGMEFISTAINLVKEDYDQTVPVMNGDGIRHEEIYVVWVTKTLENNKGLFATTRNDGLYYEITHNGTTGECYVDRYKKESNYAVKVGKSVRELYNERIAKSIGLDS